MCRPSVVYLVPTGDISTAFSLEPKSILGTSMSLGVHSETHLCPRILVGPSH